MIILRCDRCGREKTITLDGFIDHVCEELNWPEGWFEADGEIYCDKHRKVPRTGYDIIDK